MKKKFFGILFFYNKKLPNGIYVFEDKDGHYNHDDYYMGGIPFCLTGGLTFSEITLSSLQYMKTEKYSNQVKKIYDEYGVVPESHYLTIIESAEGIPIDVNVLPKLQRGNIVTHIDIDDMLMPISKITVL